MKMLGSDWFNYFCDVSGGQRLEPIATRSCKLTHAYFAIDQAPAIINNLFFNIR